MKVFTKKQAVWFLSAALLLFTGLTVSAKNKNADVNCFSYVPAQCNVIGAINLEKIKQIKSVNDAINQAQKDPMYQCLKLSGLTADNIDDIYFGIYVDKTNPQSTPSFVSFLKTDSSYDLDKFIEQSKKIKDVNITSEKYNKDNVFKFVNTNLKDQQAPVYFAKVSNKLLAIGTKKYIQDTIDLLNGGNKSVLTNKEMMNLSDKATRKDMLWVAAILPNFNKAQATQAKSKIPNITDGVIALNYENNTLEITGQLNCKTKEDVQKIMLPAQMFLGIFAMNPDNGIKPQDIQLTPKDTKIDINVKIPEKAIKNILGSQAPQQAKSQKTSNISGAPLE